MWFNNARARTWVFVCIFFLSISLFLAFFPRDMDYTGLKIKQQVVTHCLESDKNRRTLFILLHHGEFKRGPFYSFLFNFAHFARFMYRIFFRDILSVSNSQNGENYVKKKTEELAWCICVLNFHEWVSCLKKKKIGLIFAYHNNITELKFGSGPTAYRNHLFGKKNVRNINIHEQL